jgi:hypothetical protein
VVDAPKHEDWIEHLCPTIYVRFTRGPDYERAFLCVNDGEPDMRDVATMSFGQARLFMAAFAATPAPVPHSDGYVDSFYELARLLDISPQSRSPKEVWECEMLPRLRAALAPSPPQHVQGADDLQAHYSQTIIDQMESTNIPALTHPSPQTNVVGWIYEDELPEGYPYDAMFPHSKVDGVRMFPVFAPQLNFGVPQDITTAPSMTDVLVWWPIVKLDEDGGPTDEIVDGCWIISEDQGGHWIEPEVMNAIGDHMGDDHTYADKPSHWMPLPARLFIATTEGSADV